MSRHIHQEIEFDANLQRVYAALTDAAQFSALTGGAPAEISREAGGTFSCFGGAIVGRQVELAPDQRVVQAWRAGNWPAGVYSIVKFELQAAGARTRLVFDQSGFPEAEATHLADGWHKMYWEPMRK